MTSNCKGSKYKHMAFILESNRNLISLVYSTVKLHSQTHIHIYTHMHSLTHGNNCAHMYMYIDTSSSPSHTRKNTLY